MQPTTEDVEDAYDFDQFIAVRRETVDIHAAVRAVRRRLVCHTGNIPTTALRRNSERVGKVIIARICGRVWGPAGGS